MTLKQKKFVVDFGWQALLGNLGISTQDLLRRARLPLDLFSQKSPTLTAEEFFRLWEALEVLLDDPAFAIKLAEAFSMETFNPPVFACYCSPDFNTAIKRLAQYKPLVGPMYLKVETTSAMTKISYGGLDANHPLPPSLISAELVFLTNMIRLATREKISPVFAQLSVDLPARTQFETYLGCRVRKGDDNAIGFSPEDAQKPFVTASESIWAVFEPELKTRLENIDQGAAFSEKVRACLIEILAAGQTSMADVATRLAVSPRTLQRRLQAEDTSFQDILNDLRRDLALFYLREKNLSGGEISFLLGYHEPTSFYRAFQAWTGKTPEAARNSFLVH